ncbi:MAG: DUF4330 family protein [Clostridia bacterium]|nr:DUF4330 family protein [Clostridia bacterium]
MKTNKKSIRLNALDIAIIVAICAAIFAVGFKFLIAKPAAANDRAQITYELYVAEIRESSLPFFVQGDAVYDDESGNFIGTLSSFESRPAKTLMQRQDGTVSEHTVQGKVDLVLTITAEAVTRTEGFYAQGIRHVAPGAVIQVHTPKVTVVGTVRNLTELAS